MAIQEHDNDIYTKQYDDPVTKYIKNIVQRYFDIENNISKEKKETIILQAFTRLKEILNAKTDKFIMSVNEKTGAISLSMKDFNGEEKFDKNDAYNKNFCSYTSVSKTLYNDQIESYNHYGQNQSDHIVEGNDDRLSDARIPLAHVHDFEDINELNQIINKTGLNPKVKHLHKNINVLDLLEYTGSMIKIDLILIELLEQKTNNALEYFTEVNEYVTSIATNYITSLDEAIKASQERLEYLESIIEDLINWYKDAKDYTDWKNQEYKKIINDYLKKFLTKKEYNQIKYVLEHSIRLIDKGNITINDNSKFSLKEYNSVNTDSIEDIFNGSKYFMRNGYTKVSLQNYSFKKINDSDVLMKIKNSLIDNSIVRVFFRYNKNNKQYQDELPQMYQVGSSLHDFILIFYNIDDDNKINVYSKRLSYIPVFLFESIMFSVCAIDYSGKRGQFTSICIDDTEINNKYVKREQDSFVQKTEDELIFEFNSNDVNMINETFNNPVVYQYNNNRIYLLCQTPTSWSDANRKTRLMTSYLAMPKNEQELNFINNIVSSGSSVTNNFWIGGTDRTVEGEWKWLDGTPIEYNNWNNGDPNDSNQNEDALEIFKSTLKWNDRNASVQQSYIFEMERPSLQKNDLFFKAESIFNSSLGYHDRCKLTWKLSNQSNYFIRILKSVNEDDWVEIKRSQTDSSINSYNILEIFNESTVYVNNLHDYTGDTVHTSYPIGQTKLTNQEKNDSWEVVNGCIQFSENSYSYVYMITKDKYTIYKHTCTLTVCGPNTDPVSLAESDPYYDNDPIAVIVSAIEENGKLYTLSLVCDKQGSDSFNDSSLTKTGTKGLSLIYNYMMPDMKKLGSYPLSFDESIPGPESQYSQEGGWTETNKINLDIRKDSNNIYIYCSNFYEKEGLSSDQSKTILNAPVINVSLNDVQSQTGKNFYNGHIGYGALSQYGATFIDINLEIFKSAIETQYIDTIQDTLVPNAPSLTGRCISNEKNKDVYEIKIDYSDKYEFIRYKMEIYDSIDFSKNGPTFFDNLNLSSESGMLEITSFSDIKNLEYSFGYNRINYTQNPNYSIKKVIDDYTNHTETLKITVNKQNFIDSIKFCDNYKYSYSNYINDFYNKFNCHLLNMQNQDINYIQTLLHPNRTSTCQFHILNNGQVTFDDSNNKEYIKHTNVNTDEPEYKYDQEKANDESFKEENDIYYFSEIENVLQEDDITCSLGIFEFKKISDFFNNPSFEYQIFTCPSLEDENEDDT